MVRTSMPSASALKQNARYRAASRPGYDTDAWRNMQAQIGGPASAAAGPMSDMQSVVLTSSSSSLTTMKWSHRAPHGPVPVSKFTMLMTTRENRLENIFAPLTYRWEIYSVESDLQISVQKKVPLMAKAQTATASGAAACANRLWLCPRRIAGSGKARACIPRSVSEK